MNWHDHWVPVTTADQLIAFVYVSLCGQRGSRDVERTSSLGRRHVTTLGGTVPTGPAYVANHGRAEAVERQVWGRAAAERAASSRRPSQTCVARNLALCDDSEQVRTR